MNYGLAEAIFWPYIDMWYRYARVADELMKMESRRLSILDVGGKGGGLSRLINNPNYNVYVVDVDKNVLSGKPFLFYPIVADGRTLPFLEDAFDVVLAVATMEHIPKESRKQFFEDLKRVAKKKVIIYTPVIDNLGVYRAKEYDIRFNEAYKKLTGCGEKNTIEHIKCGHPTIDELKKAFPSATFSGLHNCYAWYIYMIFEILLPIPLLTGLIYILFLKGQDNKPPYYACKLVYEKTYAIKLCRV